MKKYRKKYYSGAEKKMTIRDSVKFHRSQMQKELILHELRKRGFRITRQRSILLDIILEDEFSCCKEIYYKASQLDKSVGAATVYRMINTLEEIGAISRKDIYKVDFSGLKQEAKPHNIHNDEIDYHEIIECITCALDAKDSYTAGHSKSVSDMAYKVCVLIGLNDNDIEKIHIAAHLHDIGKIGVPDAVLNKTTRLNEEEWKAIKKHPSIGAEILSKSGRLNELKDMVLYHHERYDGLGYPYGLKGDEIPIGSRIIAICDSIDAMTSDRCYRKAYDFRSCYGEIKKNLGKMYDPFIGEFVLKHWKEIVNMPQRKDEKIYQ